VRNVDNEFNFKNVPASNLSVAREIENMSHTKFGSHYDINSQLADISMKVEKSVEVNIQLQEKITQLGMLVSELAMDVKRISESLEQAEGRAVALEPREPIGEETELGLPAVPALPSMDFGEEEQAAAPRERATGLTDEIRKLTEENIELVRTLKGIDAKLGKTGRFDRIKKALESAGA
jgi:hypothetical protein